jgi:hypothetical protein
MSGGFDRKTYAREWARERYQRELAAKRMSATYCPRRFGLRGVCGGVLVSFTDGQGRLVTECARCERFERGICCDCNLPVAGEVRKARRCAKHRAEANRKSIKKYAADNRELLNRKGRKRLRKAVVRKRNAEYKRLWRKANPDKVKAQKRRAALRQPEHVLQYQRDYRIRNGLVGRTHVKKPRTCNTSGCPTSVTGRTKKCAECRDKARLEAMQIIAANHQGKGRRTDMERAA